MCDTLKNRTRRKLRKLRRKVKEVLLLSGGDPTSVSEEHLANFNLPSSVEDISLELSRKLQTMRQIKDPPKITLTLNRLNGTRIGSKSAAQLVHYVTFRNIDKPTWISIRPNRGILQTVLFRVSCDLEMVECNKKGTFIDELFDIRSFIRMQTKVWDRMEFWNSLLNVPLSKLELAKRFLSRASVLEEHIKSDFARELLVTLRQMIDFCYPFPHASDGCMGSTSLPPIIPTKRKYGTVTDDSPYFAIDCEMCTTEIGESELTRISVVNENYEVLLDTLVKPKNRISDYVTKYSGITEKMLENVDVHVEHVQKALSHILPNDAVLVGHTLECDLNALRITHPFCVDISLCLNLSGVERQRSSLKTLARLFLNEEIQGENGHCSVEDAIITMRLLKYKLCQGTQFGNVSQGWNFDEWARKNGLTSSGARVKSSENMCSGASFGGEPQQKKRCLDFETLTKICNRCSRHLSVPCIVSNCACKVNDVKNCVICCLDYVQPQSSNKNANFSWSDAYQICDSRESEPISYHLRSNKGKTAFYAIPSDIDNSKCSECEVYVNADEYNSLDELAERVSAEVISHDLVMMDIDVTKLKMSEGVRPIEEIGNALRKVISYASWNSLIIIILTSPQESLCGLTIKSRDKKLSQG